MSIKKTKKKINLKNYQKFIKVVVKKLDNPNEEIMA